ncbi:MAG: hypothetical protein WC506_01605 [Candidatus Micrarchaeia archaeon]
MITGGTIDYVEAKREKEGDPKGIGIDIQVSSVKVEGRKITLKYEYKVVYNEGIGNLKMMGTLFADEEPKKAKEIEESYKKDKRLPDDFAEVVLNTVSFTCGTNGIFVIRPVNLAPPLVPPKIELNKAAKSS